LFLTPAEAQRRLNSVNNLKNLLDKNKLDVCSEHPLPAVPYSAQTGSLGSCVSAVECLVAPTVPQPTQAPSDSVVNAKPFPENKALKIIGKSLVAQGVAETIVSAEFNIDKKDLRSRDNFADGKVSESISRIRELALDKMLIALGLMTVDTLEKAPLKELNSSVVALSKVIGQTTPAGEIGSLDSVRFIVHTPVTRTLQQFEVLDV
jgi:hypothetical protein